MLCSYPNISSASLAQSAARQSHNLKVVSSSLTGGRHCFFLLPSTAFFFPYSPWYLCAYTAPSLFTLEIFFYIDRKLQLINYILQENIANGWHLRFSQIKFRKLVSGMDWSHKCFMQ